MKDLKMYLIIGLACIILASIPGACEYLLVDSSEEKKMKLLVPIIRWGH